MKEFWKKNSDMLIKMIVHQLGLTVFGYLLYNAAEVSGNRKLLIIFGVFSAVFYWFLLYVMTWENGAKDMIRVNGGRMKYDPLKGMKVCLLANVPNLLIAVVSTVGYVCIADKSTLTSLETETLPVWAANMYGIAQLLGIYLNMMYAGIADYVGALNMPYVLFLYVVPTVLTCSLGYFFGTKEKFGLPSSPKQKY